MPVAEGAEAPVRGLHCRRQPAFPCALSAALDSLPGSEPQGAAEGEVEGLAEGLVGFFGVGPGAVGGVLDGAAAGVDELQQGIAADAVGGLAAVGFVGGGFGPMILAGGGGDGGEVGGVIAGEVVGGGFGQEGFGVLF